MTRIFGKRALAYLMIAFLTLPPAVFAQQPSAAAPAFKQEQLDQVLAPIALYPDSLIAQILIASTYPLEIVQADRWAKQNKNLKSDDLTKALEAQTWDPSVKSLVNFPQVLSMMNEKLDWTQKLGDAFLAQQKDVMDTIQKLRAKAQAAGNLKTTKEQVVIVEEKIIKIEPASPTVIYVPAYNPTVVYGAWPYPAYPPYYYYPPGYVATSAFWFAAGVGMGAAWGYAWGSCNYGGGNVKYNYNQNVTINNNINRNAYAQTMPANAQGNWQRSQATASQQAQARQAYRGYTGQLTPQGQQQVQQAQQNQQQQQAQQTQQRQQAQQQAQQAQQQGQQGQQQQKAQQAQQQQKGQQAQQTGQARGGEQGRTSAGAGDRGGASQLGGGGGAGRGGSGGGGAFEGMDRGGSSARSASERGNASRGGGGGSGGGSRGGGGRR
jgi:hypothetical protein